MLRLLLVVLASRLSDAVPLVQDNITPRDGEKCGYESCTKPKDGYLNVHIVAHTHNDVGWLKTVDQYYYGSKKYIQVAGVQYILESVVNELWNDPERKFIYVETAFFWQWWLKQSSEMREMVHTLVRQGRLQMTGAAWSMNDEAAAHYHSIIDQFTWGHRLLNDTFGLCGMPLAVWQIDPFGHSREFASLAADTGLRGLLLGRIDYQDKAQRQRQQRMELLWRGSDDLGESSDILTSVLYNQYQPPAGFCFDILCSDEPVTDDNYEERVSDFLKFVKSQSKVYATPNVLITMGGDFNYQSAASWFLNLDALIKHTNEIAEKKGLKINAFYSNPACYMKAVEDANITLTRKTDDFFPYASDPTAYWTGYFTSRPTTKYYERQSNAALQMFKQLTVLLGAEEIAMPVLEEFKSAMGMMQHHDAITGTEKQHVANDYMKTLYRVNHRTDEIITEYFSTILSDISHVYNDRCQLNISSCETTMNSQFSIAIYNPVAWSIFEYIDIPVPTNEQYEVHDANGRKVGFSVVPVPEEIIAIPNRYNQKYILILLVELPPMSLTTFYVRKVKSKARRTAKFRENNIKSHREIRNHNIDNQNNKNIYEKIPERLIKNDDIQFSYDFNMDVLKNKYEPNDDIAMLEKIIKEAKEDVVPRRLDEESKKIIYPFSDEEKRMLGDDPTIIEAPRRNILENDNEIIGFDPLTSKLIHTYKNGQSLAVEMNRYSSSSGDNYQERASGAYIFRPNGTAQRLSGDVTHYNAGKIIESTVKYNENVALLYRHYNTERIPYTDVYWIVGPIDISDDIGKEYIIKYSTNLKSAGIFYTDSNGRQMIKRKLNSRDDYNVTLKEPVPGNYYPITNRIMIKTEDGTPSKTFNILTDRSEGASSLNDGQIEVMLHRRMLFDDGFGVGEPLNETEYDKGLIVTGRHRLYLTKNKTEELYVKRQTIQNDLQYRVYFSKGESLEKWLGTVKQVSFVNEFPIGLHLLTLEPWRENQLLLRLENYFEKTDIDDTDVKINLQKIFKTLNVHWYREAYLAASKWKGEINNDSFDVIVKAKQIKTFVVGFSRK